MKQIICSSSNFKRTARPATISPAPLMVDMQTANISNLDMESLMSPTASSSSSDTTYSAAMSSGSSAVATVSLQESNAHGSSPEVQTPTRHLHLANKRKVVPPPDDFAVKRQKGLAAAEIAITQSADHIKALTQELRAQVMPKPTAEDSAMVTVLLHGIQRVGKQYRTRALMEMLGVLDKYAEMTPDNDNTSTV